MSTYQAHYIPTALVAATTMHHRTHYTKAMSFLQAHGFFAAITKDGLLTMCIEWTDMDNVVAHMDADDAYETPMVFEVDEEGMVSSRAVREWLGY